MDFKQAAANDQQVETSPRSENKNNEINMNDYVLEIIFCLETFTRTNLTEPEIAVWQNRLIQFPKWKLDSLGEYAGPMKLENISNWMNAAQRPTEPEPKKQLMDNSARACGTELWTGLKEIMRSETNDPRGDILKLLERLAIKYPQHAKYLTYRKE